MRCDEVEVSPVRSVRAEPRAPIRGSLIKPLAVALAFTALGGCATLENVGDHQRSSTPVCRLNDGADTLVLRGPTDAAMLNCLNDLPAGVPPVIEIDSLGGNVEPAMAVGDILATARPHIVVDGSCSSSCANYLLPVASRITLRPGARILLHGSIDGALLARSRAERGDRPAFERIADRQARFVASHQVPLGWLLYRSEGETEGWGQYVSGRPAVEPGAGPVRLLLVEEPFIESCLAHIPVDGLETSDAARARVDAAFRARLARQGIFGTGPMRCVEGGVP